LAINEDEVDRLIRRFIVLEDRIRNIRQELQIFKINQQSAKPKTVDESKEILSLSGDILSLIDMADFFNPNLIDREALGVLPLKILELEKLLSRKVE
jgi:hypothetical protein